MPSLVVYVKYIQLRKKSKLPIQERFVAEAEPLHREYLVQRRLFQDFNKELGDFATDLVLKMV